MYALRWFLKSMLRFETRSRNFVMVRCVPPELGPKASNLSHRNEWLLNECIKFRFPALPLDRPIARAAPAGEIIVFAHHRDKSFFQLQ